MKLKLDENIPRSASPRLSALGFDVATVLEEALGGRSDADVLAAVQSEGRALVTQDLDFADVHAFSPGTHAAIVLVRVPMHEQWRLADWLVAWFAADDARTWEGCFVVATPTKVRVRRVPRPTP